MNSLRQSTDPNWRAVARRHRLGGPIPGPTKEGGGTRNITLTSMAGRLRREGHGAETILRVLEVVNQARCAPPLPHSEIRAITRSISRKPPGDGVNAQGREAYEHAQDRIVMLHARSLVAPWRGRAGGTDQAVLHAIMARAYRAGRLEVGVDFRTIAVDAGVSIATVSNSTKRLREHHWLYRVRRGGIHIQLDAERDSSSTVWRVSAPRWLCRQMTVADLNNNAAKFGLNVLVCNTAHDDVWRAGALGKSGRRLWLALSTARWSTEPILVSTLRLHRSTVHRLVRKLQYYGLAERDGAGWRRGAADPETVIVPTRGIGAMQRNIYQRDRERLSDTIAVMRQRRSQSRQPTHDVYVIRPRPEQPQRPFGGDRRDDEKNLPSHGVVPIQSHRTSRPVRDGCNDD